MSKHTNYHVGVPAKLQTTTAAAAIQAAADAYNAAVDADGPCCQAAIDASKAYTDQLTKGLKEVGIDWSALNS